MKKIILILALSVLIFACTKNEITTPSTLADGARLKFINASVGVPAVDYFVNNVKTSPQLSASVTDNTIFSTITTGVSYLSTYPSNEYSLVSGGATAIKIVTSTPVPALVSPQTVNPNTVISSQTLNTENGKYYSILTTGYPNAIETLVFNDDFITPATGMAYVRFINASTTAPPLDLSLKYTPVGSTTVTEIIPFTAISYKNNSGFMPVPASVSGTGYTFQTKLTGTATTLGAVLPASGTTVLTPGRFYTVYARGLTVDYVVPGKGITLKATARTDTKVPEIYHNVYGLSFYTNK